MENTIDLAIDFIKERKKQYPGCCETWLQIAMTMVAYADVICTDKLGAANAAMIEKDRTISDLERSNAELLGFTTTANETYAEALLEVEKLTKAISDLRRQLSDCKAKARIGHNPDRT